ncbi:hypothetical protein Lsan_1816 [Legionella santicrucis]|uniref:Uncharacterized protein n=1 Tax=Legionella santicrucis TaxID=45074 RepID=A0A0W0YYI3_9GAMM|nr:hypothetical protein [Legionella santicrucis]KTD61973.1 hypothetical protein Lsan_1816 [Legionella santicrucis]
MGVYIVPVHAKKLNVNQFMIGYHSIFNRIQFDWDESYDFQDFVSYFQDLKTDQPFLVFKTKEEAFNYSESNEGVDHPGYLVTIRSRVPVYKVELQVEFDAIPSNEHQQKNISKSDVKRLLSASLALYHYECDIEKQQQEKEEFDANIEQLKSFASNRSLNPNVKNSLNAVIDCIQKPEYKFLGFGEKKEITKKTIAFIEGKITPRDYKSVIQKGYLGKQSSLELKLLGAALMALAITVSACLLAAGAPVTGTILIGAGLGMIGLGFFDKGQGSGVSKPLHEVFDASASFASARSFVF